MAQYFSLDIDYSYFSVHSPDIQEPFNMWRDEHIRQCMAWREDAVCFKTYNEYGTHDFEVWNKKIVEISEGSSIAIFCPIINNVEYMNISSVIGSKKTSIKETNMLCYQYFDTNPNPRIVLNFFWQKKTYFKVVRCDGKVFDGVVDTEAVPAS